MAMQLTTEQALQIHDKNTKATGELLPNRNRAYMPVNFRQYNNNNNNNNNV
jgi:hypothetical protein